MNLVDQSQFLFDAGAFSILNSLLSFFVLSLVGIRENQLDQSIQAIVELETCHLFVHGHLKVGDELAHGPLQLLANALVVLNFLFFFIKRQVAGKLCEDSDSAMVLSQIEHDEVFVHEFMFRPQFNLLLCQVHDELLQIITIDEARRIRIILFPCLRVGSEGKLTDSSVLLLSGLQLSFEDNRNEQVQKDQRDDKHEANEVQVRDRCSTSIDAISDLLIISLILDTLEQNISLPGAVVHDVLPALARRDSEQSEQRCAKRLKVGMFVQVLLKSYL